MQDRNFARCNVYYKFGEFWGMFKAPKLRSKWEKYDKSIFFNYNRDLAGLRPAGALMNLI